MVFSEKLLGENACVAEIIDFICAAQMAREFNAVSDEEEVRSLSLLKNLLRYLC